jgi:multiple sugar transport system ATP-binding protein
MADLKITGLHKYYGSFHAVKGVDLEVPSGEFTVLVGPSGCGKSTLLRTIAGLEEANQGSIEIAGKDVTWARPRDRDIAMVFQNYALYPYLTVFDNVAFGLRARKFAESEINKRVNNAAEMLGIGPLMKRYPRELSGGQRQRVAIGRAIVRDARLFLFDEPLSNLDAQLRDDMRAEIKRLHQELKRTMIYVTHDQIEAMTLADRIVLLRDGVIEQQGTPLELFDRPKTKFVAGFLGSPKMNFVSGRSDGKSIALTDGTRLPFAAATSGQSILVGIRPQHITRAGTAAAKNHVHAPVTIELVQPTGSRTQVTFPYGGQNIVAEFDSNYDDAPGKKIKIDIDMTRAVIVDAQSEKVISQGGIHGKDESEPRHQVVWNR